MYSRKRICMSGLIPPILRRTLLIVSGVLLCLLSVDAVLAQELRGRAASEQLARCTDAEARGGRSLSLLFSGLPPFAREVLARHGVRTSIEAAGGRLRIELHLESLRQLDAPEGHHATTYLSPHEASAVREDPRSEIAPLWMLDEATVKAADRAYDIRHSAEATIAGEPARRSL
jgi:hypothetical protein